MTMMAQLCGLILCLFVGALGLTIIIWIWIGKIDLSALLNEANGQASMSRFQLLIFTFVIAISLFELVEMRANPTGFPDIPNGVLTLLGISASTYAVGKGISYSQPQVLMGQSTSGNGGDGATDDAVAAAQAAASQAAVHAATAQQAAQQTATNAAKAQEAADQATGKQG
ncbi:MAG: hypothetical protein WCC92_20455 [Candidatus Korobacteraceae bacterium]